MFTHSCIKPACGAKYQDKDPDPYYCPQCNEIRKQVALEVDKRMANRPRKEVMSNLQAYESAAKTFTTSNGRTITFGKA